MGDMITKIAFPACLLAIILSGCSGTKYLEQTRMGESALESNENQRALEIAEGVIDGLPGKQKTEHGQVYALAGNAAFALEQYEKSIEYLETARRLEYRDELMYENLAGSYRVIDNLSREIGVLEEYISHFSDGELAGDMRERLFQTCLESENYDLAAELWPLMAEEARSDQGNMEIFLLINKELGSTGTCDELAGSILDMDGSNEVALNYLAEKYFWRAENSYLEQMKAYKENRTRKQYAILLEAFKTVNSDFKKSLGYFNRLYKINPDPGYADYLSRIYTRMDDKQKASYYSRKAGNE
jgi:tetratricopeptide (TPR) repeat protein